MLKLTTFIMASLILSGCNSGMSEQELLDANIECSKIAKEKFEEGVYLRNGYLEDTSPNAYYSTHYQTCVYNIGSDDDDVREVFSGEWLEK